MRERERDRERENISKEKLYQDKVTYIDIKVNNSSE